MKAQQKQVTIISIFEKFARARYYILISVLFFVISGIFYMRNTDKIYLVQMTIQAVEDPLTRSAEKAPVNGIAALFAQKERDPLSEFRDLCTSLAVSTILFQNTELSKRIFRNEVSENGNWREPTSIIRPLRDFIYAASGQPQWTEPSPQRLQNFIKTNVNFSTPSKADEITISLKEIDPALGIDLLKGIFEETDRELKRRARMDVSSKIDYLQRRLQTAAVVEYRSVISDILIKSELKKIMLESAQPAIVSIVDPANSSETPVWPVPLMVFVLAGVLGVFFGICSHAAAVHIRTSRSLRILSDSSR